MKESYNSKKESSFSMDVSEQVEEFTLRFAEMPEFQEIIKGASNKMEAIKAVRAKLKADFPEVDKLPEPKPGSGQVPIAGLPSNEYLIAKAVIDLLWESRE